MSGRNQSDPKRARKSPPRRRARRTRLREYTLQLVRTGRLPAFLLSVGLSVILGAFAFSEDFGVDSVIIRGNSIAYADSIVETSGAIGQSIFRVDTEEVANDVAAHPVVASASVRAELPDRLIVDVVEREPALVWQTGDRAVLVDEFGWVMAQGEADDLPRVVELSGDPPSPGSLIAIEKVVAAQYLVDEFGSAMTLEYDEIEGFLAHLDDDRVVTLGEPDELPVKMEVIATVQEMDVDWTRLDVRDPERPYYQ